MDGGSSKLRDSIRDQYPGIAEMTDFLARRAQDSADRFDYVDPFQKKGVPQIVDLFCELLQGRAPAPKAADFAEFSERLDARQLELLNDACTSLLACRHAMEFIDARDRTTSAASS